MQSFVGAHNAVVFIHSTVCTTVYIIIKGPLSVLSDLGVVELHGVVGGQRHHQAFLVELQQGVLGVLQEQAVVAERGHGDGDLGQEVQVLQHRTLAVEDRWIKSVYKNSSSEIMTLFVKTWHFGFSCIFIFDHILLTARLLNKIILNVRLT